MIDSFNPPDIWAPFGAFSMGVIQGEGQVVYLKGQVSLNAAVQVAALYRPELVVEITAIAEIPRDRFRRPTTR
jgi:hypothetical protein